ncbi:MAG: hypothetical protein Q4E75_01075 [bacterium]|nr:hypothetical protein [bacterium]
MKQKENATKFELKQMDNFIIRYNNDFELILNNKIFFLKEDKIRSLVNYIYEYFNDKYPIEYDYKLIDPIYFSLFFYDLLDKIIKVKIDVINIKDIRLLRYKADPVTMENSERYKALLDKTYKMYSPFKSNLVSETPEERLNNILNSIKEKGYGFKNQLAIFYNNEPYIRDGQHRVSAVKYLYGDIDIKIVRFYLKDNYFYE